LVAAFWLSDTLKLGAKQIINSLPVRSVVLLSGDTKDNVLSVAKRLAIDEALFAQSPANKLDYVKTSQRSGNHVMMLGDGINDAPVLASADVSVAVGNATDLAKSAADVILLSDRLSALPELFLMSKRTRTKIKQNITWSLGYNLLILPFAISGALEPWMAVIGMSLSSIVVVTNSTRLLGNSAMKAPVS
jgi:Cu2+-exporting ATPase